MMIRPPFHYTSTGASGAKISRRESDSGYNFNQTPPLSDLPVKPEEPKIMSNRPPPVIRRNFPPPPIVGNGMQFTGPPPMLPVNHSMPPPVLHNSVFNSASTQPVSTAAYPITPMRAVPVPPQMPSGYNQPQLFHSPQPTGSSSMNGNVDSKLDIKQEVEDKEWIEIQLIFCSKLFYKKYDVYIHLIMIMKLQLVYLSREHVDLKIYLGSFSR
jgi:hypothetical protein